MTVSEAIEFLRRFPQDAVLGAKSLDIELPLEKRIVVTTLKSYLGRCRWPLDGKDSNLPDWSQPDPEVVR